MNALQTVLGYPKFCILMNEREKIKGVLILNVVIKTSLSGGDT